MGALAVRAADLCVARSRDRFGGLVVGVGVPLADVYLEFLGGRCRPNTVLAAAYDLKVFFTVVARPPGEVRPADVLAFITAQRTGRAGEHGVLQPLGGWACGGGGGGGASGRGCGVRLCAGACGWYGFSSLSCGPGVMGGPAGGRGGSRPAASAPVPGRASRWYASPGGCRGSCPRPRW